MTLFNHLLFIYLGKVISTIHYFPRYYQKENMITNNTMLLFKRLDNNSMDKFS